MKTLQELITENTINMVSLNADETAKQFDVYHQNLDYYNLIVNLDKQPSKYWNNSWFFYLDEFEFPDDIYFSFPNGIEKSITICNTNIQDFNLYKDELKKLIAKINTEVIADITKNFNDQSFENKKDSLIADIENFEI